MKKLGLCLLTIILCLVPLNTWAIDFDTSSKNVILINLNDDKVLYEKNVNDKVYIASLTKIMTALIVLENVDDLEAMVTLKQTDFSALIKYDASTSGLSLNKSYTYKELLYGLMLESGADCANALARSVGKDIPFFVNMMNEKAKELKMINTNFTNPHGLDEIGNYSTVYDLSLLFRYALKNETFTKVIETMSYKTTDGHTLEHTIKYYKNKYNLDMTYLIGGKTGYDVKAGFCLASIAIYNDINYMLITTNATYSLITPNHFIDALTIYEYYMNNYNYHILINENDILFSLDTLYAKEDKYDIKATKDYSYYVINDYDLSKLEFSYDGIETITTKMKENDKLGIVKVYYDEELLDEIDIYLTHKIHFSLLKFLSLNPIYIYIGILLIIILILFILKNKKKNKKTV